MYQKLYRHGNIIVLIWVVASSGERLRELEK